MLWFQTGKHKLAKKLNKKESSVLHSFQIPGLNIKNCAIIEPRTIKLYFKYFLKNFKQAVGLIQATDPTVTTVNTKGPSGP